MSEHSELSRAKDDEVALASQPDILNTGVAFDLNKFQARQAEIGGILDRDYASDEGRVADLNRKISEFDDDFGISYLHLPAAALPGLEIHGVAQKTVLTASSIPAADFEGGDFTGSIFTATEMPNLKARAATFDSAVLPLAKLNNAELRDISAVDAVFSFADVRNVQWRGSELTNAFLVGVRGLTKEALQEMADVTAARVLVGLVEKGQVRSPEEISAGILSGRFSDISGESELPIRSPDVLLDEDLANKLLAAKRLDGTILSNVTLTEARMPSVDLTAGILNDVSARGIVAPGLKLAGSVILNSAMNNADMPHVWAPGAFISGTLLNSSEISGINAGGAIFYNSRLRDVNAEEPNFDGVIFVGSERPELPEEIEQRTRTFADLSQLPGRVGKQIQEIGRLAALSTQERLQALPGSEE